MLWGSLPSGDAGAEEQVAQPPNAGYALAEQVVQSVPDGVRRFGIGVGIRRVGLRGRYGSGVLRGVAASS